MRLTKDKTTSIRRQLSGAGRPNVRMNTKHRQQIVRRVFDASPQTNRIDHVGYHRVSQTSQ